MTISCTGRWDAQHATPYQLNSCVPFSLLPLQADLAASRAECSSLRAELIEAQKEVQQLQGESWAHSHRADALEVGTCWGLMGEGGARGAFA